MNAANRSDSASKVSGSGKSLGTLPGPSRGSRKLAWVIIFFLLVATTTVAVVRFGKWKFLETGTEIPEIPAISLEGVDPEIAKVVNGARDKVSEFPQSTIFWGQYGMVLDANGFYDAAHICYEAAAKLSPEDPRWPYLRGYLYHDGPAGPAAARPYFQIAANLSQPDSLYRIRLADTLLELGRLEEAEKEYRTVLTVRDDPQVQLGLARLSMTRREYRDALQYLQPAVEQVGVQKTACALLATAYERLGDRAAAERARQRLAEMPPDGVRAQDPILQVGELEVGLQVDLRNAMRLMRENRIEEVRPLVERIVQRYPDSFEAWGILRNAGIAAGDFSRAERAAGKCVELAPKNAEAWYSLGSVLISQRRFQEAMQPVLRSIELDPQNRQAYASLGECQNALGDSAGAAKSYAKAGITKVPPPTPVEQERQLPPALKKNGPVITYYYTDPRPEKARQMLVDIISPENLDNPWYKERGFILQLMAANFGDIGFGQEGLVRYYESKFAGAPDGGKRIIIRALQTCGDQATRQVVDEWLADNANAGVKDELAALLEHLANPDRKRSRDIPAQTPRDLDFLWGDFFATGEYPPISRILDVFDLPNTSASDQLKQAAHFSMVSNLQQHPKLLEIVKSNLSRRPSGSKSAMTDILRRLEGTGTVNSK